MKAYFLKPVSLGDIYIEFPVGLAPMAGITDQAFREVAHSLGAGFSVTEMISCKAINYGNQKTMDMLQMTEKEGILGLQLFGSDPLLFKTVIQTLNDTKFSFFDINMGCPAQKVVKNNEGSALMKDPSLIRKIIEAAVSVSKKPVTIKIRKGYNQETINGIEIAKIAAESGASAVFIHGRTRSELYGGQADWAYIKKIKAAIEIPVFANGDVIDLFSAQGIIETTGADGILVGRGAQGNPWIFRGIRENNHWLEKRHLKPREKYTIIEKHMRLQLAYKGAHRALREMRKHVGWYIKNEVNSQDLRSKINASTDMEEMRYHIQKFYL